MLLLLAVVCASLGKTPAASSLKGDRRPLGSIQEHGTGEPSELGHWTGEEAAGNVEEASMAAPCPVRLRNLFPLDIMCYLSGFLCVAGRGIKIMERSQRCLKGRYPGYHL